MDQVRVHGSHCACRLWGPDAAGAHETGGGLQRTASAAAPSSFFQVVQRRRRRPTYVTHPRPPVTETVRPPPARARHCRSWPCATTVTGRPATATRACRGSNASRTRTSVPRVTVSVLADAAIGAPQCLAQHHDETASGADDVGVEIVARGGAASASATRSATIAGKGTRARRRTFASREKFVPLSANPDVQSARQRVAGSKQCRLVRHGCSPPINPRKPEVVLRC
jgi:hypothetical protein